MLASSNAKKVDAFRSLQYLAMISNGIHRCQEFWIVIVGCQGGGHFPIDPFICRLFLQLPYEGSDGTL